MGPGGEVLHLSSLGVCGGSSSSKSPGSHVVDTSDGARMSNRGRGKPDAAVLQEQPWAATLYARGQRPEMAWKNLAKALQLPATALRVRGSMKTAGISVQQVFIPRGLTPQAREALDGQLRQGLLSSDEVLVALGAARPALGASSPASARHGSLAPQEPWRCEGHRYTLIVRGLDQRHCAEGLVDESLERVAEEGFVNLFETADFGLAEIRRYEIGSALWSGRWDAAARLLLTANRCPQSPAAAATSAFLEGDIAKGLELLPEDGSSEGLRSLAMQLLLRQPALEALHKVVPKAVWARHLSAVSRVAWNYAASSRLANMPRWPVGGDLTWDEPSGEVRNLSKLEAKRAQLTDVVLPLPRPGQPVPECPSRLRIEAVLRSLVPEKDAPASAFPIDVEKLMPSVRALIRVPSDMSWDIIDADVGSLIECDLVRLGVDPESLSGQGVGNAMSDGGGRARGGRARSAAAMARNRGLRGPALRLHFTLPRGSSAEVVLREVLQKNPSEFNEGLHRRDELF